MEHTGSGPDPLDIVGVDTDNVSTPSNDGSAGSSLYEVPIRLNRRPTPREADLIVRHWDQPSQWTTMHRPGIASVSGDRVVLSGTTIEEVRRYHAKTLRLAVDATNADEPRLKAQEAERRRVEDDRAAAHRRSVFETTAEITF